MPMSTTCVVAEKKMTVEEALALKEKNGRCIECGQPVLPHRASKDGSQAAHFEHRERNRNCSLSHRAVG